MPFTILITGAAGNLGSLLAGYLLPRNHHLRLMVHSTPLPDGLADADNVTVVKADLADKATLPRAVQGVDVVVHFAGVLFAPRPHRFLPETNIRWFENLLDTCLHLGAKRLVLISFPHVEGPTTVHAPAVGRLDRRPISIHAQTRLEEEQLLLQKTRGSGMTAVILRLGMVYGRGILMIEAARWLAQHRLLSVWKQPTWIHLISTEDYLTATTAALLNPDVHGIYHIGDECPVTLQHFLDEACRVWGLPKPYRVPLWTTYTAAFLCECFALLFRTKSPLTRDFITIGRVSYHGDTQRARQDLIPRLQYTTLESGLDTLM